MKIYERDFTVLTAEEKRDWDEVRKMERVGNIEGNRIRRNLFREYPKAVRHYLSLFPNNYLDVVDLKKAYELNKLSEMFLLELNNTKTNEMSLLKFIRNHKAYFIVASIMKKYYNFGHHEAYIMPEFMLGTSYKVDYLLIGKNSGGYQFVLVELESPEGNITLADGELGDSFRKGVRQVKDWMRWLQSCYVSLRETFYKYKHPQKELPEEFMIFDKSRFNYVVVAGRRKDFNKKTYRIRRETLEEQKILLLHYDNLYDCAKYVIDKPTY